MVKNAPGKNAPGLERFERAAHLVLASIVPSITIDLRVNLARTGPRQMLPLFFFSHDSRTSHDAAGAALLREGRGTIRRAPSAVHRIVRGCDARRGAPGPPGKATAGRSSSSMNKTIRSIEPARLPLSLPRRSSKQTEISIR